MEAKISSDILVQMSAGDRDSTLAPQLRRLPAQPAGRLNERARGQTEEQKCGWFHRPTRRRWPGSRAGTGTKRGRCSALLGFSRPGSLGSTAITALRTISRCPARICSRRGLITSFRVLFLYHFLYDLGPPPPPGCALTARICSTECFLVSPGIKILGSKI